MHLRYFFKIAWVRDPSGRLVRVMQNQEETNEQMATLQAMVASLQEQLVAALQQVHPPPPPPAAAPHAPPPNPPVLPQVQPIP